MTFVEGDVASCSRLRFVLRLLFRSFTDEWKAAMVSKDNNGDMAQSPENVNVPKQKTPTKAQLVRSAHFCQGKCFSPADAMC